MKDMIEGRGRNQKLEIRMTNQIRNSKIETKAFRALAFEFDSNFEFRISNFT